jgi:hypothetical protein
MSVIDEQAKAKILAMRGEGMSWASISKKLGFSRTTVRKSVDPEYKKRCAESRKKSVAEYYVGVFHGEYTTNIDPEHVEKRRIWNGIEDTRDLTGFLMGDPIRQRSALAGRADR